MSHIALSRNCQPNRVGQQIAEGIVAVHFRSGTLQVVLYVVAVPS